MTANAHATLEADLIARLAAGEFRDCYLIYNRKSTDDTNNQKNSIAYQKAVNARYAAERKLRVADLTVQGFCTSGHVSERHSGFKTDNVLGIADGTVTFRIERPKFQMLAEYLFKGYLKGVIILCWDRASRNDGDSMIIKRLQKAGCDVHFSLTEYAKSSAGILHQDVDGMFAKYVSETTSEKVRLSIEERRANGMCTYKASVGYLNPGTVENKPHDPSRAPLIRQMYELCRTGEWSFHALAKWANEQGFTMPPSKRRRTPEEILAEEEDEIRLELEPIARPVTYKQIGRILSNYFYTGRIQGNDGQWVKSASHEAIVDDELFHEVQEVIKRRNVSLHYKDVLKSPYRGLFRCAECNRAYTPYAKKGATYLGSRCREGCTNAESSLSSKKAEALIGGLIGNLWFTKEELREIDARTRTDIAALERERNKEVEAIERRKKKLREDLLYLRTNKLTLLSASAYSPEEYRAEESRAQTELNALMRREQVSEDAMSAVVKEVLRLSELLQNAYLYYQNANSLEKDELVRKIFSEFTYSQNGLKYKCKNGFEALSSRFETPCDLGVWLGEAVQRRSDIRLSLQALGGFATGPGPWTQASCRVRQDPAPSKPLQIR